MSLAQNVPAESDTLCESCGYVLNGLPRGTNCPECGTPAEQGASGLRNRPAWEAAADHRPAAFWRVTIECIFRPGKFFRTISAEPAGAASRQFAQLHWALAAATIGSAAWLHFGIMGGLGPWQIVPPLWERPLFLFSWPILILYTYGFMRVLTAIAARLTTYEATWRGLRLPRSIVLRALHYHAAHYLPVALLGIGLIGGFKLALLLVPRSAAPFEVVYLYVLSGAVVLAAVYLFRTYWTAMRNLMYANRPAIIDRASAVMD